MHIIIAADIPFLCSFSAWKCLILPTECSRQKSLILLKILPAEFIQAYLRTDLIYNITKGQVRKHSITKKNDGLRNGILQTFKNTVNSLVSNHRWCTTKW